jgi:multiple sugar transport system substrate-binding protein
MADRVAMMPAPAAAHLPRRRFLGLLLASLAAGCTARASDSVLRLWAMGREGEVVAGLLPGFERTHPGVRVVVQQLPWTAAHEKLLTAFAGESLPDVFQLGNTWIPEFVALNALEPLDAYAGTSRDVDLADYFGGILETNRIGSTLYGVPWYVDTRLLFYRRDLVAQAGFSDAPRSWPEWMDVLTAVKKTVGANRYAILLPLNEFEPLLALALQQSAPLLRDGNRFGNFESADFRRTLSFYVEIFRRGLAPPLTNADISNVWNEFGRGYFSFYISGPWNIGEFERRLPPEVRGAWMTAPLPGPDGPGASIAGGSSFVMSSASRHKALAWQLIEYLSQPEMQRALYAATGDLPPRRSAWRDSKLAGDPYARAFRDQLERVKPTPKVPEWERIATEMRLAAERAVHGDWSIDRAAAELDARADRILDKRRYLIARGATR